MPEFIPMAEGDLEENLSLVCSRRGDGHFSLVKRTMATYGGRQQPQFLKNSLIFSSDQLATNIRVSMETLFQLSPDELTAETNDLIAKLRQLDL